MACSSDESGSGFTLPIVRSVPEVNEPSEPTESTTTLPLFVEFYTIQSGDTLSEIAQIFGVSVDDLISFNAISNPDAIQLGQVLKIPSPANPSGTTATTLAP
jgi:LysM repeat protein